MADPYSFETLPWADDKSSLQLLTECFSGDSRLIWDILDELAAPKPGTHSDADWHSELVLRIERLITEYEPPIAEAPTRATRHTADESSGRPPSRDASPDDRITLRIDTKPVEVLFDEEATKGNLSFKSAAVYGRAMATWLDWVDRVGHTPRTSGEFRTTLEEWMVDRDYSDSTKSVYRSAFNHLIRLSTSRAENNQ
jgi:hypothetical protein